MIRNDRSFTKGSSVKLPEECQKILVTAKVAKIIARLINYVTRSGKSGDNTPEITIIFVKFRLIDYPLNTKILIYRLDTSRDSIPLSKSNSIPPRF